MLQAAFRAGLLRLHPSSLAASPSQAKTPVTTPHASLQRMPSDDVDRLDWTRRDGQTQGRRRIAAAKLAPQRFIEAAGVPKTLDPKPYLMTRTGSGT